MERQYVIATYLVLVNVITFVVYGMDKYKAKKGRWRTSEASLLPLEAAWVRGRE